MTEKGKGFEFEQAETDDTWYEVEIPKPGKIGSKFNDEARNYQEIIPIIGALMQDENFSLQNESSVTISKILSFLSKEINSNRNFTEAWLIKGTVFYKTEKYANAVEAFDAALRSMPERPDEEGMDLWKKSNGINYKYALELKAFSLFKLGRYKEGLKAFEEILQVYPDELDIENYKIIVYTLENESLIKELDSLPYLSLKNINFLESKSRYFSDSEKYEEVLEIFNEALEINPQDADIWRYKGSIFYILGKYEEALNAFNKSLEINSKNAISWGLKGSALYMVQNPEEALKAFDKALQKNPNILEAWFNKGFILFELGKYKLALASIENALRIDSQNSNTLKLRALILDRSKQNNE